jgi:tight adherence protein C
MSESLPAAVLCGLALGLGLWLLVSIAPRLSRPSLLLRVAPYLSDVSADARELLGRRTANPLPVFGTLFDAPLRQLRRLVGVVAGGAEVTERRLRQAGLQLTVEAFRSQQLVWAAIVGSAGIAAAAAFSRFHDVSPVYQGAFVVLAAAGGFVGRDYFLQRRAAARTARIAAELPTVLEFLTLSLSAGEGILDAIRRVTAISRGELAAELAGVTSDVATGLPLSETLTALARQLQVIAFTRAVEQITGALERGTPLADVLRAQAQDVREEAKRSMIELSGKKEVAMMVPLVFLILPSTIAFAIFPGIFVLQAGF